MKLKKTIYRRPRFVACKELRALNREIRKRAEAHVRRCAKCQREAAARQVSRSLEVVVFGQDGCC